MQSILLIIHVLLSISLIGLVLIQQGKGADAGAAFGGGASASMFGASGAGSFLTRLTTGLAIAFFITSLGLAYLSARDVEDTSIVDQIQQQEAPTATEAAPEADLPTANGGDIPAAGNDVPIDNSATNADLPPVDNSQ